MYTAGAKKGHEMNVCDLEFQGQPSRSRDFLSTLLISMTSKMLESTPRSFLYLVCNRRYERSCKKVFDLNFQDHTLKLDFFIITVGFLDPENIPVRNIFKRFGREGENPGGGIHPPWAFSVGEIPWASEG